MGHRRDPRIDGDPTRSPSGALLTIAAKNKIVISLFVTLALSALSHQSVEMSEGTGQLDPRQLATLRDESDVQDRQSQSSGKYKRDGSPSPSVPPSVAGVSVPASGRPSTGASFELLGDGDEEDG